LAGPGKPGRKKGGHNSKPRRDKGRSVFRKPKLGHGPKKPSPKSLANLRPPWKPGQSGNPLNKNLGHNGVVEVHKTFSEVLALTIESRKKGIEPTPVIIAAFSQFWNLFMKGNVAAGRAIMEWGVGAPAQTVKIMPAVDLNIGLAPEVEQPDLLGADNVTINRGDSEKIIADFHGGSGD